MEKLKLTANILFSGIGCQERGLENSGVVDLDVLAVSEIDKEAVCGYAAVHKGLTQEMVNSYSFYPDEEEMIKELTDKNIGFNPEKGKAYNWNRNRKDKEYETRKHWLANRLCHNLGDISRIEALLMADFWSCSFPCTDISCAGKGKGLEESSGTRSSLVWQAMRLLERAVQDDTQPEYILFENVKDLIGKFKQDFEKILAALHRLGYKTYWNVINAKNCGIPQTRERVFIVCIREETGLGRYTFPVSFECSMKVGDILSPGSDISHPIHDKRLVALLDTLAGDGVPSGMALPVVQDIPVNEKTKKKHYSAQRLTPTQCFQLMGLTPEDADKCRGLGIANSQLCRQAGNGIVTNCVQLLGEHLYKLVKDPSFVCTDERMNGKTDVPGICNQMYMETV